MSSIDFSGVLQGHLSSTVQTVQSSFQSTSDAAAAREAYLVSFCAEFKPITTIGLNASWAREFPASHLVLLVV